MALMKRNEDFPALPGFFRDFFNRDWFDWTAHNFSDTNTTLPSVNIKEDSDSYEVEMAAPGLQKKDFNIELNQDVLTISCEKKIDKETRKGQEFTRREFSYQSFSRSFTLPNTVDSDKISARYENGILMVMIPKKEEARTRATRNIEIN